MAGVRTSVAALLADWARWNPPFRGPHWACGQEAALRALHLALALALAGEDGAAALRAAFGPLGLRRVIALARPENAASLAVMRKLGMEREGEMRVFGVRAVRCAAHAPPPPPPPPPEDNGACSTS